jgi:acylphosphatase
MFMAAKRVRVVVSGDVQGVGFRWYTREEAMGRGVAGSVRNLPDGKVEAVFEGDARAVDAMVEWCRSGRRGRGSIRWRCTKSLTVESPASASTTEPAPGVAE